jgi:hypothetical protein
MAKHLCNAIVEGYAYSLQSRNERGAGTDPFVTTLFGVLVVSRV